MSKRLIIQIKTHNLIWLYKLITLPPVSGAKPWKTKWRALENISKSNWGFLNT